MFGKNKNEIGTDDGLYGQKAFYRVKIDLILPLSMMANLSIIDSSSNSNLFCLI